MHSVEVLEHDVDAEVSQGPGSSLEGTVSHLEVDKRWPDSFAGSFSDYASCNLWYAYSAGADDGPLSNAHGPTTALPGAGKSIRADPHCWCAGFGDRTLQQGESWERTTKDMRWCHSAAAPYYKDCAAPPTAKFPDGDCWVTGRRTHACQSPHDAGCFCHCSLTGGKASDKFTGMQLGYQPLPPGMDLFGNFVKDHQLPPWPTGGDDPFSAGGAYSLRENETGIWYHHLAKTECPESMDIGSRLPSGETCTWKRMPQSRVIKGEDLVRVLKDPGDRTDIQRYLRIMRQNIKAVRKVFDDAPLGKWSCGVPGRVFPPSSEPAPPPPPPPETHMCTDRNNPQPHPCLCCSEWCAKNPPSTRPQCANEGRCHSGDCERDHYEGCAGGC